MKIRIGTRGSRLALAQTNMASEEIRKYYPEIEVEIVKISTKGDRIIDEPLTKIGGKGIFVSEIERMLKSGEIDMAVHSAKDLPVILAEGTLIGAVLKRGNPRDVLAVRAGTSVNKTSRLLIKTSSLRRRNALSRLYPNANFDDIRGNVDTRLCKLSSFDCDALVLAAAGLERLGLNKDERFDFYEFPENTVIPAPCQGIIAVQSRSGEFCEILRKINDDDTYKCFETEREVIRLLDAGCITPIGTYAEIQGNEIKILAVIGSADYVGSAPVSDRLNLAGKAVNELLWKRG